MKAFKGAEKASTMHRFEFQTSKKCLFNEFDAWHRRA